MKAFVEIHLKLIATIWIILVCVLGMLLLMNYMKFSSLMSSVVASQLQVISSSVERSIIKAEQLGLPLKEMQNLPVILARERKRESQINAIYVINSTGETLFQSITGETAAYTFSQEILRRALKGSETNWTAEDPDILYSGLQLLDATGQMMGNIIILYDKNGYQQTLNQVLLNLTTMTLLIFCVFALFIFLAVRLGFSDINNVLKVINRQLQPVQNFEESKTLKPGSMAFNFARQIEQSKKMKEHVARELAECEILDHHCEHSASPKDLKTRAVK